ncbi:MAG TPA: ABC transporter permease subunit, partial [bacterium]|nr:ABC transporter permease subunit [bacterium]
GPITVQVTLSYGGSILNAAGLGFLGMGAQPPTPEWGAMLSQARSFIISAPWTVTFPGIAIFLSVLGFNILGDGLRDFLDPRLR